MRQQEKGLKLYFKSDLCDMIFNIIKVTEVTKINQCHKIQHYHLKRNTWKKSFSQL